MATVSATLSNARISARKARLVAGLIRGVSYTHAETQLRLSQKKASTLMLGVLRSAKANALHNAGLTEDSLLVQEVLVNEAGMLKRFQPRARGQAYMIRRRQCHMIVVLSGEPAASKKVITQKTTTSSSVKTASQSNQISNKESKDSQSDTSSKQSRPTSQRRQLGKEKGKKAKKSSLTSSESASSSS